MAVITLETYTVKSEGQSVDLIIWQRFKRPMPGLLERILDMPENQQLEHQGFTLALGTTVTIPIESATEPDAAVISLFG
jgi:phage tail protein X